MTLGCPSCSPKFTPLEDYCDNDLAAKLRSGIHLEFRDKPKILASLPFAEAQLQLYEELIDVLRSHQRRIKFHIAGSRSLFAPIRKLSQELLVRIFEEIDAGKGIEISPSHSRGYQYRLNVPLLTASHVCAQWRRTVFETRSLWSHISVHRSDERLDPIVLSDRTISFMKHIFGAASPAWSKVKFQANFLYRDETIKATLTLFELLQPSCHLWESLSFSLNRANLSHINDIAPHLVGLRKLRLNIQDTVDGLVLDNLPSLTHLDICLTPYHVDDRNAPTFNPFRFIPSLPWMQLTTLKCDVRDIAHLFYVLSRCRNLLHISIHLGDIHEPDHNLHAEQYTMTHLRTFTIGFRLFQKSHYLTQVFRSLTVPSLTEMTIRFHHYAQIDYVAVARELGHLRDRSGFSLSTLTIVAGLLVPYPAILDIISLFPSLTYLRLYDYREITQPITTPDFFDRLAIPSHSPLDTATAHQAHVLLPQLQRLSLQIDELSPPSLWLQRSILEMVRSRCQSLQHHDTITAGVKQFTFRTFCELEDEIVEGFRQLEGKGLGVKLYKPEIKVEWYHGYSDGNWSLWAD